MEQYQKYCVIRDFARKNNIIDLSGCSFLCPTCLLPLINFIKNNPDIDIQKGVTEGWIGDQFQKIMRNAHGSSRTSKYLLKLSVIPSDYFLTIKNFNEDAEEFAEDYPEYS